MSTGVDSQGDEEPVAAAGKLPVNVGSRLLPRRDFWAVWALLLAFTIALSVTARFESRFPGDLRIARAIQAISIPFVGGLLHVENTIGSPLPAITIITVVTLALLLMRHGRLSLLFVSTNALRSVGSLLKGAVDRPRPNGSLVHVAGYSSGASFPSGHVFSAVLLYGSLAVLIEILPFPRFVRRGVQVLCLLIVLLMGPARVYVGAHWPSDVIGGYLWGSLLLLLALEVGSRWVPEIVRRINGPMVLPGR